MSYVSSTFLHLSEAEIHVKDLGSLSRTCSRKTCFSRLVFVERNGIMSERLSLFPCNRLNPASCRLDSEQTSRSMTVASGASISPVESYV